MCLRSVTCNITERGFSRHNLVQSASCLVTVADGPSSNALTGHACSGKV